jgi:hypothetical protein
MHRLGLILWSTILLIQGQAPIVPLDDAQPLAANVERVAQAFEFLGAPLDSDVLKNLRAASNDSGRIQQLLDAQTLLVVTINPNRE